MASNIGLILTITYAVAFSILVGMMITLAIIDDLKK